MEWLLILFRGHTSTGSHSLYVLSVVLGYTSVCAYLVGLRGSHHILIQMQTHRKSPYVVESHPIVIQDHGVKWSCIIMSHDTVCIQMVHIHSEDAESLMVAVQGILYYCYLG